MKIIKLDLSKSCRTLLKNGVRGVQGVPNSKTNDITISCKTETRDTGEGVPCPGCPDDGKNTGQGHRGTPEKGQGVQYTERITARNNSRNIPMDTGDTGDTEKKKGTTTSWSVPIEKKLKPCPICGGRIFIHGENGGYFCSECQPGARRGYPVQAGGNLRN